jgi:phosphatidylcholine synthase
MSADGPVKWLLAATSIYLLGVSALHQLLERLR